MIAVALDLERKAVIDARSVECGDLPPANEHIRTIKPAIVNELRGSLLAEIDRTMFGERSVATHEKSTPEKSSINPDRQKERHL